jgi:hypothetical protein
MAGLLCPPPAGADPAPRAPQLKLTVLAPRQGTKLELCRQEKVTFSVQVTVTNGKSPAGATVTASGAGDSSYDTVGASGRMQLTLRMRQEGDQVLQVSATHPQYGNSGTVSRSVKVVQCAYEITIDYSASYKPGDGMWIFKDIVHAYSRFTLRDGDQTGIKYSGSLTADVTTKVLNTGGVHTTCKLTPSELPDFEGELDVATIGDHLGIYFAPWPQPVTLWEGTAPNIKCHTVDPTKTVDWEPYGALADKFDMVHQFAMEGTFVIDIGGGSKQFVSTAMALWRYSVSTHLTVRVTRVKPGQ